MTNHEALAELDRLLAIDAIRLLEEPTDLQGHWRSYAGRDTSSPNLWMDAYLAAFAVAGGMQMVTMDTGFRQFDGLDVLILETA